jgi:hypothetical protein
MEVSRNLCFYSSTEICSVHRCSLLFGRSQFRISVPRLDVIGHPTTRNCQHWYSRWLSGEWQGAKTTYSCSSDRCDVRLNLSIWPEWEWKKMAAGRTCHELQSWVESKLQRGHDPVFEHRCWVGNKPIPTWCNISVFSSVDIKILPDICKC